MKFIDSNRIDRGFTNSSTPTDDVFKEKERVSVDIEFLVSTQELGNTLAERIYKDLGLHSWAYCGEDPVQHFVAIHHDIDLMPGIPPSLLIDDLMAYGAAHNATLHKFEVFGDENCGDGGGDVSFNWNASTDHQSSSGVVTATEDVVKDVQRWLYKSPKSITCGNTDFNYCSLSLHKEKLHFDVEAVFPEMMGIAMARACMAIASEYAEITCGETLPVEYMESVAQQFTGTWRQELVETPPFVSSLTFDETEHPETGITGYWASASERTSKIFALIQQCDLKESATVTLGLVYTAKNPRAAEKFARKAASVAGVMEAFVSRVNNGDTVPGEQPNTLVKIIASVSNDSDAICDVLTQLDALAVTWQQCANYGAFLRFQEESEESAN